MKRQGKAFLLSFIIHLSALACVSSISGSIMGASEYMTIDLAMVDISVQGGFGETVSKNEPAVDKSLFTLRAKPERNPMKADEESQTETTPSSKPVPVPPAMETHGPVSIPSDSGSSISNPGNQSSSYSTGSGVNQSVSGQVVENSAVGGGGSGKASKSERSGDPGNVHEPLRQRYISQHFAYIKKIIQQNITYPPPARKAGWVGTVTVSFIVLENGHVDSIRILKSSGYGILDYNAIRTIRDVSPFPKPPVRAELQMPIIYKLE